MGKPCLLPDEFADQVELLEATPPEVLNTPQRYAVYLAGINRRNPPSEQRSFGDIAGETNKLFQSVGKDAFTPQKLSRLVSKPEVILEEIRVDMESRVPEVIAGMDKEEEQPLPSPALAVETALPDSPAPEPVIQVSASETLETATPFNDALPTAGQMLKEEVEILEERVIRGTLQFVEFLAHETGDTRLSDELHQVIGRMNGQDYTNPLIATSNGVSQAFTRHNEAVSALPGKALETVQSGTKAIQDALTTRAIQDKAAFHEAVGEPVQQAWKAISDKTGEVTSAIGDKTSAIGNLFRSARAVASAAVEVLNDARKDGSAIDRTAAMQAMQNHLRQRD